MATRDTLADPTNFGNKPGDGPLRVGGQPAPQSMIRKGEDRPDTRSVRSEGQMPELEVCRDLWGGKTRLTLAGQTYLPQAPGEDAKNYSARLMRSAFFNAFRRTVEGLSGLVFRNDPKMGDDVPDQIVTHWENIDMAGTHGDVFTRELLEDDLTAGHAAILVDFPDTGGMQSAGAEITEIRPYWVPIKKENIMSWRTESEGGANVLTQVVIREIGMAPVGEFGEAADVVYRVIKRGPPNEDGSRVTWQLLRVAKNNVVIEEAAGAYSNQDEIPLAEIISAGRESMFVSTPPLIDLAYLNIAHYQNWSDYMWSAHKTNVPFIFGSGMKEVRDSNGNVTPLIIGANTFVSSDNPDADMKYVSHDGASLGETKALLDDLKADMGALGLSMLSPQKRTAETAEAKRLDKSTSDSALSVTARGLQDGIENAMQFHANYLRVETGGSIEINRDFEGLMTEAPVMTAFAGLVGVGFPPRLVLNQLQAGGRISDDADLDALELEWLAGMAGVDDAAAMMPDA